METVDEKGDPVAFNQFGTFVVGAGKFGGPRSNPGAKMPADPPSRAPDATMSEKTGPDQVEWGSGLMTQCQRKLALIR